MTDGIGHWSLCDHFDHSFTVVNGMARSYHHERLYRKFPLCRRFGSFSNLNFSLCKLRISDRADTFQGIGMVISAQWELVLGNTYAYTVLSAFGFFYGGFGAIITPLFGVAQSYGTDTVEYNNALGYFVLRTCP